MNLSRDAQRDQILQHALSLDRDEQAALLDRACSQDPELRLEIDRLLRLNDQVSTESLTQPGMIPSVVIGPYHLLQMIGHGGMGEVWLADQRSPVRRRVALKLIKTGMDTREVVARFESERQALALMDHQAIAKIFEAGSTPRGRPYFAMEYVPGIPITHYCDKHKLTTKERLELFARVCEGVQHAHQKAIIHRDLKPSNILVSEVDGEAMPKIIDFGVAKAIAQRLTAETMFTRLGALIGTPGYMSPEQADSSGEDIDTRADVYSLGVILYELLVGALPLDCRKLAFDEILRRLREEDAPRPSTKFRTIGEQSTSIAKNRRTEPGILRRQLRGDLDCLTLKALEKDRARRYGNPSELAADIQRYLRNEPISAGPSTVTYRARKFAAKYRWWLAVAAAFVAMLVAGTVVSTWEAVRANQERDKAIAAGHEANAQKLTAYAIASLSDDPERSIILATRAVNATLQFKQDVQPAAEEVLHSAIMMSHALLTLQGHQDALTSVAFSPDGKLLATSSWDETAKLWDAATGRELLTLRGHPNYVVNRVAFSPDGRMIATAGGDGIAKVWDTVTGREALALRGHDGSIGSVAFDPSGKRIATVSRGHTATLWNAENGHEMLTLRSGASIWCAAFSPDGNRLATCSERAVTIWNLTTGREALSFQCDEKAVASAAFSPDGRNIATAGSDSVAKIWDAKSGRELLSFHGHKGPLSSVAFSSDGKRLATSGRDGSAKLWNVDTGQELLTLRGDLGPIASVAFSSDGTRLAAAGQNKTAKVWDTSVRGELLTFEVRQSVFDLALSPDGMRLATADADHTVKLWDATTGQPLLAFRGHREGLTAVRFSPDGKYLATSSADKTAKLWDAVSGRGIVTFLGHRAEVLCVNFSPDGQRLVTASSDRTVKVWDATSGRELMSLPHDDQVASAAFSPDGKRIVAASVDNTVKLSDAITGRPVLSWRANRLSGFIVAVAFSLDGNLIAAAGGNTIGIWRAGTGENLTTLHETGGRVTSILFRPHSTQLVAANVDGMATLWDAMTGHELLNLSGESKPLTGLAFSADGRRLATADIDGLVRIYAVDIRDLLTLARKRVTRSLTVAECRTYFQTETCASL